MHSLQRLAAVHLALVLVALGAAASSAQDLTVIIGKPPAEGPRSFGGSGATPISNTTVIQFLLEPRDSGGAQLAYALVIKGAPGWYNQRTKWAPTDSVPGFEATNWDVGTLHYVVAYNKGRQVLRTFGQEIDLGRANLVLVTLGSQGASNAAVVADRHISFLMLEPGGFVGHFLSNVPELASFAGLQAPKQ